MIDLNNTFTQNITNINKKQNKGHFMNSWN